MRSRLGKNLEGWHEYERRRGQSTTEYNAFVVVSRDECNERNSSYLERHHKATERVAKIERLGREHQSKILMRGGFIQGIETRSLVLEEFDERLWAVAVDRVKIMSDGRLLFQFKIGAVTKGSQQTIIPSCLPATGTLPMY